MHFISISLQSLAALTIYFGLSVITFDVFMRYIFHAPLLITHDIVTLYIISISFYSLFGVNYYNDHHIEITFFEERMSRRWRCYLGFFRHLCVAGSALIGVSAIFPEFLHALNSGERLISNFTWPVWTVAAIALVGWGTLLLAAVARFVQQLMIKGDARP